ncbi:GGDEF domain-containing response regulator [Candidatus Viridilinea mediisalina]|uniref:Diguanylate cyclase response regulator n=1 Tax=Candidatus Viridilinea mediisalina TaxID=2024553 RepID=A0A2A6RKJ3_9CHLR|nr:response regulator [Candidatus Viridilinea mediisalina]PDW03406.1 hypothetical protein CJ255_09120 [Candidatus Viridilinea mediisalina]
MNTHVPPEIDQLIHAVMSPLTSIHSTAQLLQRCLSTSEHAQVGILLSVLERNVVRLQQTCECFIHHASIHDQHIHISLPVAYFNAETEHIAQVAQQAVPQTQQRRPSHVPLVSAVGQILLLIPNGTTSTTLSTALARYGHQIHMVHNSVEGLDLARTLHPTLILIDPEVDAQSEFIIPLLSEDPETKSTRLALLGQHMPAGQTMLPQLINPQLTPEQIATMINGMIAPDVHARTTRPHILIVDDESDIAAMLAHQLEDDGFQTTQVYSGTAALRLTREQPFDLILLDLMLPDLDGFTVLGGLRAQPKSQLSPIILVSAINSPTEKVRGLQLGADDYITKPYNTAELSARVLATLRRSEREGGANPSTRLPGNIAIERAINRRITQGEAFAVCYCDIDNFKAYNDSYGFLKGDAVIKRTAQILLETMSNLGNPEDFVGHIGGDDFVLISSPERVEAICRSVIRQFDATAPFFYDPAARHRGKICGEDRQGRPAEFPIVTLTITVVSSTHQPFQHLGEVAQRSIAIKKRGKRTPGSVYVLEGR